jgi:DNA polymerase elongation subunit (family B)
MRYLILDIETLPHPDANQWLEPVTAAANLKDPVKVAASIAERQAERDDKLGLDPDCCVACAIGWHVVGGDDPTVIVCQNEYQEVGALRELADAYAAPQGQQETRIVTFYGRQFDLPVLMRRAMYLGVKFPALNLDRYRSPHIDVWDALTYNGALRTAHSLKFYCKRLGIQTGDMFDGSQVAQLAKEGRWDDIKTHCIADLGATHALANRLGLLRI